MNERNVSEFKNACRVFLMAFDLTTLRAYGRSLQLKEPTKMKKADLIEEIICALCGEIKPQRSNRGAPIKNSHVDPDFLKQMNALKEQYHFKAPSAVDEVPLPDVSLQFSIQPSTLNKKQKQLLNEFLNSL